MLLVGMIDMTSLGRSSWTALFEKA